MNPTPASSSVIPSTTLWIQAAVRGGALGDPAGMTYDARLRAVMDQLAAQWPASTTAPSVAGVLSGVEALQGFAMALGPDAKLRLRIEVTGHDSNALNGIVSGLGPVLDLLALHVEGMPMAHGAQPFDYLHQLIAMQATQGPEAGAGFKPTLSWTRDVGGTAGNVADADWVMAVGANWHALQTQFSTGQEADVFVKAVAHLLAGGAHRASDLMDTVEAAAKGAFGHVSGWLQKARQVLAKDGAATTTAHAPKTVTAATKDQWKRVMIDEKARYSVCGYQARMEKSIGLIYLGMDESDPRYAPWSGPANAAAAAVPESEGFERALRLTRSVLRSAGGSLGIKPLTDQVLGCLCTEWFGIPDGVHMRIDGSFLPFQPPGCPGQFSPPSGFIAEPDPGLPTRVLGELDGHLIIDGALAYIRALRQANKVPDGSIGAALFAQFPDPAQEVQLARTLIGLMMGFLPPAQINLIHFFEVLKGDAMLRLQQQYTSATELDLYKRADLVLRKPMMAAMQQNPMPPQMWRTAVSADQWPGSPPVDVQPGDKVILDVLKVTQADLAAGVLDVAPIFGGNRDVSPFPTHACPGIWAGMGVFLGILAGTLLEASDVNAVA